LTQEKSGNTAQNSLGEERVHNAVEERDEEEDEGGVDQLHLGPML
jgi:hypothetical protein